MQNVMIIRETVVVCCIILLYPQQCLSCMWTNCSVGACLVNCGKVRITSYSGCWDHWRLTAFRAFSVGVVVCGDRLHPHRQTPNDAWNRVYCGIGNPRYRYTCSVEKRHSPNKSVSKTADDMSRPRSRTEAGERIIDEYVKVSWRINLWSKLSLPQALAIRMFPRIIPGGV